MNNKDYVSTVLTKKEDKKTLAILQNKVSRELTERIRAMDIEVLKSASKETIVKVLRDIATDMAKEASKEIYDDVEVNVYVGEYSHIQDPLSFPPVAVQIKPKIVCKWDNDALSDVWIDASRISAGTIVAEEMGSYTTPIRFNQEYVGRWYTEHVEADSVWRSGEAVEVRGGEGHHPIENLQMRETNGVQMMNADGVGRFVARQGENEEGEDSPPMRVRRPGRTPRPMVGINLGINWGDE